MLPDLAFAHGGVEVKIPTLMREGTLRKIEENHSGLSKRDPADSLVC
jgi:hypothetical protein